MLLSASLTARPSSVGPRHHAGDGRAEPIPWRLGGSNGSLQSGDAGGAGAGGAYGMRVGTDGKNWENHLDGHWMALRNRMFFLGKKPVDRRKMVIEEGKHVGFNGIYDS